MKRLRILGFAIAAFCIIALVVAVVIVADTPSPAGPGGKSNELVNNPATGTQKNSQSLPPNEAIASCTGKSAGDVCQFQDRQGSSTGVCDNTPGVLACAPGRDGSAGQGTGEKPAATGMNSQPATVQSGTNRTSSPQSVKTAITVNTGSFALTSNAGANGDTLPTEYSCDGAGSTPALSWSGAPEGTKEYALMMTTIPVDGSTRWNWVLYGIPGSATGLAKNSTGVGTTGTGSHGTVMKYDPPCPQGTGAKTYTLTLYALSASPALPSTAELVTGPVLTSVISSITLGKASFDMNYGRS